MPTSDVINFIIVGTIFFLLLGGSIVLLINLYSKTRRSYYLEKQNMQQQFQQEILKARLEIQENTFNHISREIHDNVGQLLSLAKVQLNIIEQTDHKDKSMVYEVKETVGNAMSELRDIARSLSGERMQQRGLVESLEQEISRINRSDIVNITISICGEQKHLNAQKQLILFRIAQEAFQNVIKHASARDVAVLLNYLPDKFELNINDDGRGFEPDVSNEKGLGLESIKSRALLIGGEATIFSKLSQGTCIKVVVPYE